MYKIVLTLLKTICSRQKHYMLYKNTSFFMGNISLQKSV